MKQHNLVTQEKLMKINQETKAVTNDFLSECKSIGLTEATVNEYNSLLHYAEVLIHDFFENKSILEMTRSDFRNLKLKLQFEFDLSHSRINSILSVLSSCLNYIEDDEDTWTEYFKNPLRRMKRLPKKPVKEKVFISRSEVKMIINRLVANWRLQDAVMISLLYDSGCRISELHQIKKTAILDGNTTNEVIRKGRKKKTKLIFLSDTKELISKWLELRGEDDIEDLFIYPDFPTSKNSKYKRAVTKKCLEERVHKLGSIIGKNITPHVFRRTRAETLKRGEDERLGRKFDPREIQVLLGHNDLSTTQIYLKDDTAEIMQNMIDLMKN